MWLQKLRLRSDSWGYSQAIGVATWFFVCTNVMRSTWSGDDWPNSQAPYLVLWRYGQISVHTVYTEAMYWNNQWMIGQGRFYPLSWIETRFAFSYLRSLWEYKLLESFMLFFSGILLIVLIYLLSSSRRIAIFVTFALPVFVQFRNDFDPHLAFGFMVESLLIKVEIACIFAYFAGKAISQIKCIALSILSGIFLFAGCCTYEYAFLLIPLVLIMYWTGTSRTGVTLSMREIIKRKSVGLSIIIIAWLGYAIYVFGFLRVKATAISGAYVLSISWKSIIVFISQFFAPIPLDNFSGRDLPGNGTGYGFSALVGGLILISLYSYFIRMFNRVPEKDFVTYENTSAIITKYEKIRIFLFGLTLVIAPSFMLAIQPIWWGRASIVHSYLGILLSEFGYVVLFAFAFDWWLTKNAIKVESILPRKRKK